MMKYENRIIAFIDILGFRDFVLKTKNCEEIGMILKLPYELRKNERLKTMRLSNISISSISDSFVISIKASERNAMNKIIMLVSVFYTTFFELSNLLIRGAISIGELYHDHEVVYGPAMIKAYELERTAAKYPRIIIENDDLILATRTSTKISREIIMERFIKDNDDMLFLDVFTHSSFESLKSYLNKLNQKYTNNDEINNKIDWIRQYIISKLQFNDHRKTEDESVNL